MQNCNTGEKYKTIQHSFELFRSNKPFVSLFIVSARKQSTWQHFPSELALKLRLNDHKLFAIHLFYSDCSWKHFLFSGKVEPDIYTGLHGDDWSSGSHSPLQWRFLCALQPHAPARRSLCSPSCRSRDRWRPEAAPPRTPLRHSTGLKQRQTAFSSGMYTSIPEGGKKTICDSNKVIK